MDKKHKILSQDETFYRNQSEFFIIRVAKSLLSVKIDQSDAFDLNLVSETYF